MRSKAIFRLFPLIFVLLLSATSAFAASHIVFTEEDEERTRRLQRITDQRVAEADSFATRLSLTSGTSKTSSVRTSYNDVYLGTSGSWGQTYSDIWGIKKINADSVWSQYTGRGIKIAVVDTGVLMNHEDIASNIWTNPYEIAGNGIDDDRDGFVDDVHGWDFVGNDADPTDLNGHGSHVAGIAAAALNNSKGIAGVAPNAKIIPVRVLDQNGSGTFQAVANGIRYAAKVGADIINLSLGAANLDRYSLSLIQSAVNYARSLGKIVIAAAGNSNANVNYFSPANLSGVIAVGATDAYDNRASFSNYGSKLFITAPGVDILSLGSSTTHIGTRLTNNYYRASGTSMAAPFVSGAVALLLEKYPGASLEFIASKLAAGASDLGARGWDSYYGYGRLDVAKSLGISTTTTTSVLSSSSVSGASTGATIKSKALEAFDGLTADLGDYFDGIFGDQDEEGVSQEDFERAEASLRSSGRTGMDRKDDLFSELY